MNTTLQDAPPATRADRGISAEDRYVFDLQGYITVPDVLEPDLLAELNRLMDEHIAKDVPNGASQHRFIRESLLAWGSAYIRLIDHPRIAPYLKAFIDDHYRLDHDYADLIRHGHSPIGASLHGGNSPYDACCSYHHRDGRIRSGLVAVAFNLHDVLPGDGGFGCIPGSHRVQEPLPSAWVSLDPPAACVRAVPGRAGSAVVFTEALTHGTLPWRGQHERRTVFLKYSPVCVSWYATFYRHEDYAGLTETQRILLEPPNARYQGRSVRM